MDLEVSRPSSDYSQGKRSSRHDDPTEAQWKRCGRRYHSEQRTLANSINNHRQIFFTDASAVLGPLRVTPPSNHSHCSTR
jgi:hypothetical protein